MKKTVERRDFLTAGLVATLCTVLGFHGLTSATDFPTREIRLILPLTPGSSVDTLARAFSDEFAKALNQPVIVENRPGADSTIATRFVESAKPDGYTIMLVIPAHAINVAQYPSLPYDPIEDFTLIAMAASNMNILVVHPDSPINTVQDLIDRAKAEPGKLNFGNAGGTSGGSSVLLNYMADLDTVSVLYKGASGAITDLIGGRIDFMFTAVSTGMPYIKDGRLKAVAVTGPKRYPDLPGIPTVKETVRDYEVLGWYGLVGPAGLPDPVVQTLNQALFKALEAPTVRQRMASIGSDAAEPNDPDKFKAFVKAEIAKWKPVTPSRE